MQAPVPGQAREPRADEDRVVDRRDGQDVAQRPRSAAPPTWPRKPPLERVGSHGAARTNDDLEVPLAQLLHDGADEPALGKGAAAGVRGRRGGCRGGQDCSNALFVQHAAVSQGGPVAHLARGVNRSNDGWMR